MASAILAVNARRREPQLDDESGRRDYASIIAGAIHH